MGTVTGLSLGRRQPKARDLIALASLAMATVCCTRNIVIHQRPGDSTGTLVGLKHCEPDDTPCTADPSNDTSRFNASGTAFFSMPECPYKVDRILVQHAESSHPVVIAQCAAPGVAPSPSGGGIPTTQPGGVIAPKP
jgi:hypothetical protein